MPLDIVELAAIVALNGVIDCLLVAWLAGRRSRQALEKWLISPRSKEAKQQIFRDFWTELNTPSIEVKRKVEETDDKGNKETKEVIEKVTPLQNVIMEIGHFLVMKLKAIKGGEARALNDALRAASADPNNPQGSSIEGLLLGALSGRKGSPVENAIAAWIVNLIRKGGAGGSGGGGGSW